MAARELIVGGGLLQQRINVQQLGRSRRSFAGAMRAGTSVAASAMYGANGSVEAPLPHRCQLWPNAR